VIKFINKQFGTEMWVAEDRVEEYKAAGHKLAAKSLKTDPTEEPKKAKKSAKKK